MIFVGGIHGVGKTYFCNCIKERMDINVFSSSSLIERRKAQPFVSNKLTTDIDINQQYLLSEVNELKRTGCKFLLDGHFCLLNEVGEITKVSLEIFTSLQPDAIILITDDPKAIAARRRIRDGEDYFDESVEKIIQFQDKEVEYAREISVLLDIDLLVVFGNYNIVEAINFIKIH